MTAAKNAKTPEAESSTQKEDEFDLWEDGAARFWDWLVNSEGSTRSLALIRLGLVANVWARWANDHVLYRDLRPESLIVAMLFFVSSTMVFIGLFTRWSSIGLALSTMHFVYIAGHINGHEPYTHHHTTLLANACFLLALSPCGRSFSVDRYLALARFDKARAAGRDVTPPSETANLWALRLMALQVAAIYFWGGHNKLNVAFLSGDRMLHYLMFFYTGPEELDFPGLGALMGISGVTTVALEFALAFGLFFKKTRKWLFIPGLLLHAVFYFSLSVFTFSSTMWTLYLAFFDPKEVDEVIDRLLRRES